MTSASSTSTSGSCSASSSSTCCWMAVMLMVYESKKAGERPPSKKLPTLLRQPESCALRIAPAIIVRLGASALAAGRLRDGQCPPAAIPVACPRSVAEGHAPGFAFEAGAFGLDSNLDLVVMTFRCAARAAGAAGAGRAALRRAAHQRLAHGVVDHCNRRFFGVFGLAVRDRVEIANGRTAHRHRAKERRVFGVATGADRFWAFYLTG